MAHKRIAFGGSLFLLQGSHLRLSPSFCPFAPATPTANNEVDGSLRDKSQVLDGPQENRFWRFSFLLQGFDNTALSHPAGRDCSTQPATNCCQYCRNFAIKLSFHLRLSPSFCPFAPASLTANNGVDGSLRDTCC